MISFTSVRKMNGTIQNEFANHSAFVLENHSSADVARAVIESGYQKEPFYVFDMDEVYRRIQHFKRVMPRVQIFYAMKANDFDLLLKLAAICEVGFDCASSGEIYKIRQLGVNPLSIIYAMPTKTPEQMIYARESGIIHTTFDSSSELKKIKLHWPEARLLIRIRVDGECVYKLGEKFGCNFKTEAVQLLEEAAELQLQVVGVAFHVGSGCSSVDSYEKGLCCVKALFEHEAKAGRKMKIVDIGGGFLSDRTDRIDEVANRINKILEEYFPDQDVQVIAEPGRYICDSSFTLYCSICSVRKVTRKNEVVNMIYLNDGLYGTLRFTEAWHTVEKFQNTKNVNGEENATIEKVILWGPSCDSADRVMQNMTILLPSCTPNDWLVFATQGAYTFTFASQFSCLPSPRIRTVISSKLWHMIKQSAVFMPSDFNVKPDVAVPLQSTMPLLIAKQNKNDDLKSPTLNV
ncbi:unnamed protein product [Parnassius apollo]|uniref:(apollo) hypothetical protein n=1 Tax=Parnassius apollo TaxID=110799 RepID=A0A8S3WCK8_PARAO|nr:unnamed protein product [Parnassius apollo]